MTYFKNLFELVLSLIFSLKSCQSLPWVSHHFLLPPEFFVPNQVEDVGLFIPSLGMEPAPPAVEAWRAIGPPGKSPAGFPGRAGT